MFKNILKLSPILLLFMFFGVQSADAAVFRLSADKEAAAIGDTLKVNVLIDSEGRGINAAEAVIQFPTSILEVTELSKDDSIFNFWLEDPVFSNERGRIDFLGGASSGFSGASLQILEITFEIKGGGDGEIVFLDGAVTASDGSGTNLLREMHGVEISILPESQVAPGVTPSPDEPPPPPAEPPPPIQPPVQIERPAIPTGDLPEAPVVRVPLYPNPEDWNNLISKFSAIWDLPDDVTGVATLLNNVPNSTPTISEGLFESKSFVPLEDGIWYLHVRFRNNIGWGPTTHYRIAVDTAPPVPFTLSSNISGPTDDPSPILSYRSGDDLSGLLHYAIRTGVSDEEHTLEETHKVSPLPPGAYTITVAAVDNAGNSTESSIDVEILPIESPIITFVSERVVLDESNISIAGTALANATVRLTLYSLRGDVIAERDADVDELGNWSREFREESVRKGKYIVLAKTIDARGAQSLEVESAEIIVKDKPLLTIFGIDISTTWFFILLILMLIVAFVLGFLYERSLSRKRGRNIFIVKRDVVNAFNWIAKEANRLLLGYGNVQSDTPGDRRALEAKRGFERIRDKAEKSAKYLNEEIEEIK